MWTVKSAKPELWRKRCDSGAAVILARMAARRALDDLRKLQTFVVVRPPKGTMVVDNVGNYAVVSMRVRYEPESNLEYAKRFFRNTPKRVEVVLRAR